MLSIFLGVVWNFRQECFAIFEAIEFVTKIDNLLTVPFFDIENTRWGFAKDQRSKLYHWKAIKWEKSGGFFTKARHPENQESLQEAWVH